jgi:hypothetical protein
MDPPQGESADPGEQDALVMRPRASVLGSAGRGTAFRIHNTRRYFRINFN